MLFHERVSVGIIASFSCHRFCYTPTHLLPLGTPLNMVYSRASLWYFDCTLNLETFSRNFNFAFFQSNFWILWHFNLGFSINTRFSSILISRFDLCALVSDISWTSRKACRKKFGQILSTATIMNMRQLVQYQYALCGANLTNP